jgi:protein-disulfide isomerase
MSDSLRKSNDSVPPAQPAARSEWMGAAYFLLGVVIGIVSILVFNALTTKPALDTAAVQQASRNGALEALATMQAAQSAAAPESVVQAKPAVASEAVVDMGAFALRGTNRKGDATAPITIVEFSDFQCPFCRRAADQVLPQLVRDYVDTGKATLIYKHTAFLGLESSWAAVAAECAADQNRFWDFHNLLFSRQNGENQGAFNKDKLLSFAKELDLDLAKFEPCLNNEQTLARVQADTQEGRQAGVTGTPTFFINGQKLAGAQSYDRFRAVIDSLLTTSQ